jgi:hypothetical protein
VVQNRVGVEKVDIYKNGVILGDRKCLGDPRKSFVGHPDATQFGTSSADEFFNSHSPSHSPSTLGTAKTQSSGFRAVDGQTAPYCLFLRLESPCRLGQRDLAIETASN